MDELVVHSVVFLHGAPKPTVAVLSEDIHDHRNVKVYEVDQSAKA